MSIITYQEASDYTGVSSSNYKLQVIVDGINEFIEDYIWYSVTSWNKTETIKLCDITKEEWAFFVKTPNAKTLNKVNWQTYTWVKWFDNTSDYRIIQDRKFIVDDLYLYTNDVGNIYFEIEYNAGFAEVPKDLKSTALILFEIRYNKKDGKDIESYQLWPRSISFGMMSKEEDVMWVMKVLNKYKTISIPW